MERDQACEQCADGSHRCHDNPCMGSAFGQIRPVQHHKVADMDLRSQVRARMTLRTVRAELVEA